MHYYQIVYNGEFAGVGTSEDLRKYQQKHGILLCCAEDDAQYIELNSGGVYHAAWMRKETMQQRVHPAAEVTEIDEETYNKYVDFGEKPEITEPVEEAPEPVTAVEDDSVIIVTIDYLKKAKLDQLSDNCQGAIKYGFDCELSDGTTHHFSLSDYDQINLASALNMVQSGTEKVPYHADGEELKFFSADDIMLVAKKAEGHKLYHIAYHNSLKAYVNSMDNIDSIRAITYGVEIPDEYKNEVLQGLSSYKGEIKQGLEAKQEQIDSVTECILEMSEAVYG